MPLKKISLTSLGFSKKYNQLLFNVIKDIHAQSDHFKQHFGTVYRMYKKNMTFKIFCTISIIRLDSLKFMEQRVRNELEPKFITW